MTDLRQAAYWVLVAWQAMSDEERFEVGRISSLLYVRLTEMEVAKRE